MKKHFSVIFLSEDGQGALEYGLIIAVVVVGIITALSVLSDNILEAVTTIGESAEDAVK